MTSKEARQMLGRNIETLRQARGLSQVELASRLNKDKSYVSGLENAKRNPTLETLCELAKALNVSIRELFK